MLKITLILICICIIFAFVYGASRVLDASMKPAIEAGDFVLYYRLDKRFAVGDVAIFQYQGKTGLGRVAAMEGDVVDITSDGLMINGAL